MITEFKHPKLVQSDPITHSPLSSITTCSFKDQDPHSASGEQSFIIKRVNMNLMLDQISCNGMGKAAAVPLKESTGMSVVGEAGG